MKKELWVNKFEVVGIVPGKILFLGKILDLSNENLPIERVQKAFDSGCKYLKLKDTKNPTPEASPDAEKEHPKTVKDVMENLNQFKEKKKEKKKSDKANPS